MKKGEKLYWNETGKYEKENKFLSDLFDKLSSKDKDLHAKTSPWRYYLALKRVYYRYYNDGDSLKSVVKSGMVQRFDINYVDEFEKFTKELTEYVQTYAKIPYDFPYHRDEREAALERAMDSVIKKTYDEVTKKPARKATPKKAVEKKKGPIVTGPRGGAYRMVNGRKVYCSC